MHLLFLTSEQWPTFRADVATLFGKYLPRLGITCDLVTELELNQDRAKIPLWPAGKAILCSVPSYRAGQYIVKFFHQAKVLMMSDYRQYQAVQVRDMTVIALLAMLMCKLKNKPFYYWLSYPQSEGQIQRAKARGYKAGILYWFPLLQGLIGKWLLYKIILPQASHVFVQSQAMLDMVAKQGISPQKMTPVPMGVDLEAAQQNIKPSDNPLLINQRVLVYLGTLDRVRQIEILFSMLFIIRENIPNIMLVLAGDTEDKMHREWLKKQAEKLGIMPNIIWTGWLPMAEAWRYVLAAEIGLSPIPRGYLLDMSSPTKAIEYMALGLPVIANDNPDQVQVIAESGAGVCGILSPETFAGAVITMLNNAQQRDEMSALGKAYVVKSRGYHKIATTLAEKYQLLLTMQQVS